MADWNGNEYAATNLRAVKESIMAYTSFAEKSGYSPVYEKAEAAQAAVQELIDVITN
jgi:hypothetical protein